ncbi:PAS-domain containing protein [Azospirillum sp. SYSU D00513]|uniref:PAS-domain containing protein n=1 Tax=Azospirillum sp. SYSU D00513 TaxID=2812561 RepID=UPI001A96199E|nr:PAS-domain containing protein [Azospirillum sp. SYSU D00513]
MGPLHRLAGLFRRPARAKPSRPPGASGAAGAADLLQATLGAMTQGLLVWSADQRLLVCNARLAEILELPPGLLRPGLPREAFLRHLAERGDFGPGVPAELAAQRMADIGPETVARAERVGPDGRVLDIVCTRMRDGSMLMTYTDITAARRAETELRESEERFRKLSEASMDGILVHDQGRIADVNGAAAAMLGLAPEEMIGRSLLALVAPEDHGILRERFVAQAETPFELGAFRADGTRITVQGESRYVQYRGRRMSMVSFRDITAQRRDEAQLRLAKEQAEQANQAKSEFLRMISHEIRTPMNGVLGMLELLMDEERSGALRENQRSYARTARESAEALLSILNDILDLSQMEAGKLSVEKRRFNLVEVVEGVVALQAARAAAKRVELAVCVGAGVPEHVRGDDGRLRQVLLNLVGNAVKFTEEGGVAVTVALDGEGDAPRLRFEVADTGVGIPDSARERLFTEFAQVHPHLSRRHGGAGLGLAISKRLVELMGGGIGCESEPGRGSRFWFVLPLAWERAAPAPDHAPAHAAQPGPLAGRRLLLLEPNAVGRELTARQLRSWGAAVTALDGLDPGLPGHPPPDQGGLGGGVPSFDAAVIGGGSRAAASALARRLRAAGAGRIIWLAAPGEAVVTPPPGVDGALPKPARRNRLLAALTAPPADPWTGAVVRGPDLEGSVPQTPVLEPLGSVAGEGRILLVEDSRTNQMVAAGLLRAAGHRVEIAENGLEALRMVQAHPHPHPFDLVLMDLAMPEMDGLTATRALRALPAPMGTVPVIAMTADVMEADRERCLAAGMNDHIAKPLDRARLLATIARWLAPAGPMAAPPSSPITDGSPGPAGHAAVDGSVLERLGQDLDPGLLADIVRQFMEETLTRAVRIAARDITPAELAREAHSLKSTAATFGALPLSEAASALEQACRRGAEAEADRLRRAIPRLVEEAVSDYRGRGYL